MELIDIGASMIGVDFSAISASSYSLILPTLWHLTVCSKLGTIVSLCENTRDHDSHDHC